MAIASEAIALKTEHVFDYHARLRPPVVVGAGPYGTRVFWESAGGRLEGDRVRGDVLTDDLRVMSRSTP
jgi:Protein of unknown function (DUF3237)